MVSKSEWSFEWFGTCFRIKNFSKTAMSVTFSQFKSVFTIQNTLLLVPYHIWHKLFRNLTQIWMGVDVFLPLLGFPEMIKMQMWCIAAFSNFSLETFKPNLVLLTYPSLEILGKNQTRLLPVPWFLVRSLVSKNCHNSRNSNDIDMKLGPVTKLSKKNTTTSDVFLANYDFIVIFSILWLIWSNQESGFRTNGL